MARTLGLVVAVLLVCGAAYAQPMDGTIVQWDWFDTSTPSGQQWWSYVADYVHHELGAQFEISGGGVDDRFPVAVAGGVPIDAIQVPYHLAQSWAEGGLLYPITQYLERDNMSIHEFIPGAFDPVTVDGQIYAIPWIADYRVLLLNVDRWEEVGIDVFITEDWNWSMFLETAQKLTRYGADGEPVQTGYAADASRWTWLPWLFSNGGSFFNEDETAAAFNTEAGREALEFLNQLYTVDVMHPELTGRPNFLAGRAAMFHTYPGEDNHVLTSAPDMNVWYAMIPQGPSGFGPVTDMNINYRAIPATTQNPDLAWEYLKWYHTARTVKYEIMGSHRSPWVPFYESAEWVYSLDDYPHRATIPEFMQKTKFDPVKELSAWSGEVNHLISAAIRGELDPGNALEQAEQIVNAALSAR